MKTIDCPDCAGMGSAVKKVNRRKTGGISSVEFDLKKDCPFCEGQGKVQLLRGNVIRSLGPKAAPDAQP
jgi:RecJ-like exonuclease